MPVAKIHVLVDRYDEARPDRVSNAVQQGLISALGVPPDDLFQIVHVLPPAQFRHTRSLLGWRTHALSDGTGLRKLDPAAAPVTTGLGVLGMPRFTAYGGLRVIGKPQPGETVVVAAASGPVGSLVGQLAQLAGARAVGIAGGPQKCAFVKEELRFDAAIDHRAADFTARLAAACPDGIDV